MEWINFIIWSLTETAKYIIISFGILGLEWKKGYGKWLAVAGNLMCIGIFVLLNQNKLFFETIHGLVILLFFFDGRIRKKIQAFILQLFMVSILDLFIWSVLACFVTGDIPEYSWKHYMISWISMFVGCVVWIVIAAFLKNGKRKIRQSLETLPMKYYLILLLNLAGLSFIAGIAQGNVLNVFNEDMHRVVLTISTIVVILYIIMVVVFVYTIYVNKQLEMESRFTEKCIRVQKTYYEKILANDEETRRFRHDITKHIGALNALCDDKKDEEIYTYIRQLGSWYVENLSVVRTGNPVADYFVNYTINQLEKVGQLKYKVIGYFPKEMMIESSDLCVLMGNAMENVQEALCRMERNRRLNILIRNYQNRVYLEIANSVDIKGEVTLETIKDDKKNHGFGFANMQKVVEKYYGSIEFEKSDDMFILKINI